MTAPKAQMSPPRNPELVKSTIKLDESFKKLELKNQVESADKFKTQQKRPELKVNTNALFSTSAAKKNAAEGWNTTNKAN